MRTRKCIWYRLFSEEAIAMRMREDHKFREFRCLENDFYCDGRNQLCDNYLYIDLSDGALSIILDDLKRKHRGEK